MMNCKFCGQELVRLGGNSGYDAYGCNDWHCHIFKQPQTYRPKNPDALPRLMPQYRRRRYTYEGYKVQKRENYQILRNLGIPASEAGAMTSNKQTQLALENGIPKGTKP